MKLYYYCSSCNKENSFNTKAKDRFELKRERGNIINERCKKCGTFVMRRVNRVHAKPNKVVIIVGTFIGILLMFTLLAMIPTVLVIFIFTGIFTFPYYAWKMAEKKALNFNKAMVSDD